MVEEKNNSFINLVLKFSRTSNDGLKDGLLDIVSQDKEDSYFSRISMLGKIDMSTVWTGYNRMPEMVGYQSKNQRRHYVVERISKTKNKRETNTT